MNHDIQHLEFHIIVSKKIIAFKLASLSAGTGILNKKPGVILRFFNANSMDSVVIGRGSVSESEFPAVLIDKFWKNVKTRDNSNIVVAAFPRL